MGYPPNSPLTLPFWGRIVNPNVPILSAISGQNGEF